MKIMNAVVIAVLLLCSSISTAIADQKTEANHVRIMDWYTSFSEGLVDRFESISDEEYYEFSESYRLATEGWDDPALPVVQRSQLIEWLTRYVRSEDMLKYWGTAMLQVLPRHVTPQLIERSLACPVPEIQVVYLGEQVAAAIMLEKSHGTLMLNPAYFESYDSLRHGLSHELTHYLFQGKPGIQPSVPDLMREGVTELVTRRAAELLEWPADDLHYQDEVLGMSVFSRLVGLDQLLAWYVHQDPDEEQFYRLLGGRMLERGVPAQDVDALLTVWYRKGKTLQDKEGVLIDLTKTTIEVFSMLERMVEEQELLGQKLQNREISWNVYAALSQELDNALATLKRECTGLVAQMAKLEEQLKPKLLYAHTQLITTLVRAGVDMDDLLEGSCLPASVIARISEVAKAQ